MSYNTKLWLGAHGNMFMSQFLHIKHLQVVAMEIIKNALNRKLSVFIDYKQRKQSLKGL